VGKDFIEVTMTEGDLVNSSHHYGQLFVVIDTEYPYTKRIRVINVATGEEKILPCEWLTKIETVKN